jgi:hypothetical protein
MLDFYWILLLFSAHFTLFGSMAQITGYQYKRVTWLTKAYWQTRILDTISAQTLIECGAVCSRLYNSNTELTDQQCYAFSYDKATRNCQVANPEKIEWVSDVNAQKTFYFMEVRLTAAQLAVAQLAVAQLAVAQLAVAQLAVAQLAVAQLAVAQLAVAQPAVAQLD